MYVKSTHKSILRRRSRRRRSLSYFLAFNVLSTTQVHLRRRRRRRRGRRRKKKKTVSWCFEPSQPQGITSGLRKKKEGQETTEADYL